MTTVQQRIQDLAPRQDPLKIEAAMRQADSDIEHLRILSFAAAVRVAASDIRTKVSQ